MGKLFKNNQNMFKATKFNFYNFFCNLFPEVVFTYMESEKSDCLIYSPKMSLIVYGGFLNLGGHVSTISGKKQFLGPKLTVPGSRGC